MGEAEVVESSQAWQRNRGLYQASCGAIPIYTRVSLRHHAHPYIQTPKLKYTTESAVRNHPIHPEKRTTYNSHQCNVCSASATYTAVGCAGPLLIVIIQHKARPSDIGLHGSGTNDRDGKIIKKLPRMNNSQRTSSGP